MMNQKETAIDFLRKASAGDVETAYENYIHPAFRHHNPWFKGNRESLKEAMEAAAESSPNEMFEVQRSLEDGDMVAVHSHVRQENGTEISVVHIMRFEEGKIIELWDVGMVVPGDSPNMNGVF